MATVTPGHTNCGAAGARPGDVKLVCGILNARSEPEDCGTPAFLTIES